MDTKVTKNLKLKIELLDWEFVPGINALDITYSKEGKENHLKLYDEGLGKALDKAFIIDSFYKRPGFECMVKIEGVMDSANYAGLHEQTEFGFDLSLAEFMENDFTAEDAYKLIYQHEENENIKAYAKHIAEDVQKTLKSCFS